MSRMWWKWISSAAILLLMLTAFLPAKPTFAASSPNRILCDDNNPLCTEPYYAKNYEGNYIGHDEPSVLFYDNRPGSGNSNVYSLTLPKDPPVLPKQDGSGGTFNFQLHPAFWFGMAMCDSESAPEYTKKCIPDSDANIFDSSDPNARDYIGHHPGGAFMEMQFYPPGWILWPPGDSCDPTKWCAALNIDSLGLDMNTNIPNNTACLDTVGEETVNFAFITRNGIAQAPANPVEATAATYTPDPTKDLFMNSGDEIIVSMHDTPQGFQVILQDLTNRQTGSMIASAKNGFGQVKFDPAGTTCQNIPYDFHPMYSTSSEHTRLSWTAHSYNVAFSDEIGHFEFCNAVDANGNCTAPGVNDPNGLDDDDTYCFGPDASSRVAVGGCFGTDLDFDGVPYQTVWPGTNKNARQDRILHPTSILFSSPLFNEQDPRGKFMALRNYKRVAFEADLPAIESACDFNSGAGCVNPPPGANFYPFYSTRKDVLGCLWQEGGPYIPGTTNTFGGSSVTEFGSLLKLFYPDVEGPDFSYEDFRNVLNNNPCPVGLPISPGR